MRNWTIALATVLLAGCSSAETDAEKDVAAGLLDPSSAQFRNVRVNADCVLGEVNGKNSFGAYTGFKPFAYVRETKLVRMNKELPGYEAMAMNPGLGYCTIEAGDI